MVRNLRDRNMVKGTSKNGLTNEEKDQVGMRLRKGGKERRAQQ